MICPHCKKDIPEKEIAKHFASNGGKKSKRAITPEQQAKMQDSKRAKLVERSRAYYEAAHKKKGEEDGQA